MHASFNKGTQVEENAKVEVGRMGGRWRQGRKKNKRKCTSVRLFHCLAKDLGQFYIY